MKSLMKVPRAIPGRPTLEFDVTEINDAASREMEVASVTPLKAPELLATFNKAFCDASRIVVLLTSEVNEAKAQVDRVRARVILDKVPEVLKEKGLTNPRSPAGSEDLRQAILDVDPEHIEANEKLNMLTALRELMRVKAKGLENSYSSVKRLLSEGSLDRSSYVPGAHAGNEGSSNGAVASYVDDGFGVPKY